MTETGGSEREVPEFGLIADEDLPDDLQPEQNPLARDPEEESSQGGQSREGGGDAAPQVEGEPGPAG